jgi:hypothetical protein
VAPRRQPQPSHYSGVEVPRVWEPTELIAGAFKGEVKPPGTYGYSNTNWIVVTELRPALEVPLWTKAAVRTERTRPQTRSSRKRLAQPGDANSIEGDGDRTGLVPVDGEEVAVVGA